MVKKLISKKKNKTPKRKKSYISDKISSKRINPQDKSPFEDMWDVISGPNNKPVSNLINDSNHFNSTEDHIMSDELDNVTFNELEEFISNLPGVITENEEQELLQRAELVFTGDLKELATEIVQNKKGHSKKEEAHNKGHKEEEKANNKKAYNKGHEGEEEEEEVEKEEKEDVEEVAKKEEDVETKTPSDEVEEKKLEATEEEEEDPEEEEKELTMGQAKKLLKENGYSLTGKTKTKMKHNSTEYQVKNDKGKMVYMTMKDIYNLMKDKEEVNNEEVNNKQRVNNPGHYGKHNKKHEEEEITTLDELESKIAFEPHMMFDPKTGKGFKAKNFMDHLKYKKMGYTHKKPTNAQLKKNRHCVNDQVNNPGHVDKSKSTLSKEATTTKMICPGGEVMVGGKCAVAAMIEKNKKR